MSSTEIESSVRLARRLFETVILPVAESRRASGAPPYFPLARDETADTYFSTPILKRMAPEDFELPGGGHPNGLIEALIAFWEATGDQELAKAMASKLEPLAEALGAEARADDGSVDILCYTLF
jgi:hypothetical protein